MDDRSGMHFKLPPDQMRRLEKLAHSSGKTKQAFVEKAVLESMAEAEEHRSVKKMVAAGVTDDAPARKTKTTQITGGGLGINDALRAKDAQPHTETSAPTTPVVVNVGSSAGSSPNNEIDRLAAFVVAGNELGRDMRLRTAVEILHATTSTPEERRTLSAKLDEAIAARTKNTVSDPSAFAKAARVTFDRLASLWGDK